MVRNVHERVLPGTAAEAGALLDTLASRSDALWPGDRWPAMRFDKPLGVGASGGHGPVRYVVDRYEPGRLVRFRFTSPRGFHGTHSLVVLESSGSSAVLRHELTMTTRGCARLSWPLVFRPLHDALIEDALDRASAALGQASAPRAWSVRVRVLRWILRRIGARRSTFTSQRDHAGARVV
jgi:hypothetical protein